MSLLSLFTSFEGRISRKPYWIGSLLLLLVFILAALAIVAVRGADAFDGPYSGDSAISLFLGTFFVFASIPLMVKRLHDRNKSGHYVWLLVILEVLWIVGSVAGITGNTEEPNGLGWSLAFIYLAVALWLFIELGFLRGTAGDNIYGPDPLGGTGESKPAVEAA